MSLPCSAAAWKQSSSALPRAMQLRARSKSCYRLTCAGRIRSTQNPRPSQLSPEIFWLELDRHSMRRAIGRMIPCAEISLEGLRMGHAFAGEQTFERVEPMVVVGLPRIGIARRLRALDLLGKSCRPFRPGEQAACMQGKRHGEGLRLPWLAENGAFMVAGNAWDRLGRLPCSGGIDFVHAGSR